MLKPIVKRTAVLLGLLIFLIPDTSLSAQENRIALVIGNGDYKSTPLANPVNDANDMATALERCDFKVMKSINADRKEMRKAIREFGDEINKGAVGLFYYAGHGIQVNGENYLVPIGAEVYREDEVRDECLMVSSVLRKMETAGNRLNIIILDACRDNPFGRSFRSSNMGLAKMDAPTGSILAYATAPGSVAADGTGGNGLYTSMLLKHILTPNLTIERVFKRVRIDVVNSSGKTQIPWESSSLMGDFYFNAKRGISVEKRPMIKPETPAERFQEYASISPEIRETKVVARDGNFVKYENDVVFDAKTNLEWFAGPDRGTNWNEAKSWVEDLSIADGGWRMPTRQELKTIYQKGAGTRSMTPLLKTNGWWVWGEARDSSSAWGISFYWGNEYWYNRTNSNGNFRGFAVRSQANRIEADKSPNQVRASHILIKLPAQADKQETEKAIKEIRDIQQKLKDGEDFALLAKKFSEGPSGVKGGDLGFFGRGQMVKPFEDEAFKLNIGEVSDIVRTSFGLHLIKVTDRKY